ncbi:uncharacterized protein LOC110032017 [Phalaenopsis equestris]|uniref:uncharacterized protein LOC110032017 n=1 Tax=Phalaenopsis equestris TaxID=78828 RepID=UPI0009E5CF42|nr:uncharacterized protein LOC110032017 [Phalaenopsis equestris]
MAATAVLSDFVEWRENIISQERGNRIVHYYLEDSNGKSHLAVIGTERSLRHMLYVVSEEFHQSYCPEKSGVSCLKWRSRREVVDWLSSFLPGKIKSHNHSRALKNCSANPIGANISSNGVNDSGGFLHKHMDLGRSLKGQHSEISWSGISWICGKQLKHYQAFYRNGTTIFAHSFVLVMSEEETLYLAYLEDMYEDKKGQKKVKVRWFHQDQEFDCTIPPPAPHPNEVFITPYSQVISAECVDDVATILTPEHYEKFLATSPYSSSCGLRLCFRQYNKKKFKFFDLTTLGGYFNQPILSSLDICSFSGEQRFRNACDIKHVGSKRMTFVKSHQRILKDHLDMKMSSGTNDARKLWPACRNLRCDLTMRRPLSVKFIGPRNLRKPPFRIDEKIELLCQDSGIRGCWFKCTVLRVTQMRLKVRYDNLQNEDDCGNLEEWVPAFKVAAADKLGMRVSGRFTIRPSPECNFIPENAALQIGTAVDAWWNDGWWEGVVIGMECRGDDNMQIYIPGEDFFLSCQRKNVRISNDWSGNGWVRVDAKPDILSQISSVSPVAKPAANGVLAKGAESGCSAMSDRQAVATKANSIEADKQTEGNEEDDRVEGSSRDNTNGSSDCVKSLGTRKRCRDDTNAEIYGAEVDLEGDDKTSN